MFQQIGTDEIGELAYPNGLLYEIELTNGLLVTLKSMEKAMSTILITGAGSGFGKEASLELARRGHHVIAGAHIGPQVTELKQAAQDTGVELQVEKLDILNPIDRTKAETWKIDVLINNAGVGESGPLAEIPLELVRSNFEVNVFATLELTQKVVHGMLRKDSGRIIIVSSIAGLITVPYLGAYCMTKHALEAMGEALRAELLDHNISVHLLEPGPYLTGFNDRMMDTKYQWFGEESLLANDMATIHENEALIVADQYNPQGLVTAMVDLAEGTNTRFRNVFPEEWENRIRQIQAEDK